MKYFLSVFVIFIILVFNLICLAFKEKEKPLNKILYEVGAKDNSLPCERMYYLIETYSDSFCVPKYIAYNVAYRETRYRGPLDTLYNPKLKSKAGAIGAMQIMPQYASYFAEKPVTKHELMHDLELNVWLSMKILSKHYNTYQNWTTACGVYNTGKPILNKYAKFCGGNLEFVNTWVDLDSSNYSLFF